MTINKSKKIDWNKSPEEDYVFNDAICRHPVWTPETDQ